MLLSAGMGELSRRDRRIAEFKSGVLRASAELFVQRGVSATTLDDICEAADVAIAAEGPNEVFVDLQDGVATTSDLKIEPTDGPLTVTSSGGYTFKDIGLICSSAETATVRLMAFPSK